MKRGDVSCIVPVFNMERHVGEAIQSLLDQTLPPREVIVIDDGSTDSTACEVACFGDAVTYLRQQNAGVSSARNAGLRCANAEFVCFLDADDRCHPEKLACQLEVFARDPRLQFCDAYAGFFWSAEMTEAERQADHRFPHPFWKETAAGHISTWMVRRTVFDQIGGFDEALDFSEDTDWLLRCRDVGLARETLPKCLGFRRLHRGNATAGNRERQVDGLVQVFARARTRRDRQHR